MVLVNYLEALARGRKFVSFRMIQHAAIMTNKASFLRVGLGIVAS